jgi:hypothetical protein
LFWQLWQRRYFIREETNKMTNKHTQGTWILDTSELDGGIIHNGVTIAQVPIDALAWKANAHLIAAAPELLEALEEFLLCGENAGHNDDLKAQARAAIAKAKGE